LRATEPHNVLQQVLEYPVPKATQSPDAMHRLPID